MSVRRPSRSVSLVRGVFGVGEQEPGGAAGGCHGAVAFGAALVEVADQQVGAAGAAQCAALVKGVGDGAGRVVGPTPARVAGRRATWTSGSARVAAVTTVPWHR